MSFRDVRPGLHGGNLLNCTVCGVDFTPATAGVVCRAYCKDCELRFLGAFYAQRATAALVRACKVAFMNERSHLAAFSCSSSRRRLQLAGCNVPAAGQAARCRLQRCRLQATGCRPQAARCRPRLLASRKCRCTGLLSFKQAGSRFYLNVLHAARRLPRPILAKVWLYLWG